MKIKFSKQYNKLWNQSEAELLAVKDIKINKQTAAELIEYDTKATDGSYYPLKSGAYIQLVFLGDKGIPFCTIRAAYPQHKVDYYRNNIGNIFKIEMIEGDNNAG